MPLLIKKLEYSFNYMAARFSDETLVVCRFKGFCVYILVRGLLYKWLDLFVFCLQIIRFEWNCVWDGFINISGRYKCLLTVFQCSEMATVLCFFWQVGWLIIYLKVFIKSIWRKSVTQKWLQIYSRYSYFRHKRK